jgi:hypothetical protein
MPFTKNADGSLATSLPDLLSYTLQLRSQGDNKDPLDHASIFNPTGSGKVLKVRVFLVQPETSGGTAVIVLYELHRISAYSGGSPYTPLKRDTTDVASVAEVVTLPTSVTDDGNIHSFILQANTVQGVYIHRFGSWGEKPIVLREGEGLLIRQITANYGWFHITTVWTEE